VLPLTFVDPGAYELVGKEDRISVFGLAALAPGQPVTCQLTKPDGATVTFECAHTFSPAQVAWFRSGSALNVIRQRR
jgi:aconitate hydratase